MKSPLFLLGCFCLMVCSTVQAIDWDKCGSGKQILQLWKLKLVPDPIRFSGKGELISFQADIYEDIPSGATLHINIWKIVWVGWDIYIHAPCFLPTGCDAELCSFLNYFGGECPVTKGLYEGDNVEFDIPDMSKWEKWFASGRFYAELQINGPNSEQLTCWSFKGQTEQLLDPRSHKLLSLSFKGQRKQLTSRWNHKLLALKFRNVTSM